MRVSSFLAAFIAVTVFVSSESRVQAALVTLNVNQANSSLTISGSVFVVALNSTFPMQEQLPGSLTTSYTGTITVDVDDLFNPTSIAIIGSNLDAVVSSIYLPTVGGEPLIPAAPGDYGVFVPVPGDGYGSVRGLIMNVSAASTGVAMGNFAVTGQTFSPTTGTLDVFAAGLGGGDTTPLTQSGLNNSASLGNYAVSGGQITLTIPADFTIGFSVQDEMMATVVTGSVQFVGSVTAVAAVPEPTSFGLALMPVLGTVLLRRPRRKHS